MAVDARITGSPGKPVSRTKTCRIIVSKDVKTTKAGGKQQTRRCVEESSRQTSLQNQSSRPSGGLFRSGQDF